MGDTPQRVIDQRRATFLQEGLKDSLELNDGKQVELVHKCSWSPSQIIPSFSSKRPSRIKNKTDSGVASTTDLFQQMSLDNVEVKKLTLRSSSDDKVDKVSVMSESMSDF